MRQFFFQFAAVDLPPPIFCRRFTTTDLTPDENKN